MYHPWRHLASLHGWAVTWQHLPAGLHAVTHFDARRIILDPRLRQAERRCALAHEIVHVERGPVADDDRLAGIEEAAVCQIAARRLIGLRALGEALAWSLDTVEVAEALWVDDGTLRARMEHLHPVEVAYLMGRTEHHRTQG